MKKFIGALISLCAVFGFSEAVYAAEAPLLNDSSSFSLSFGSSSSVTDGNRATKLKIEGEQEIKIESLSPVHALYIVWDDIPLGWTMYSEQESVVARQSADGFLHEYVSLNDSPDGYTSLTLKISGGAICDIYAFGNGDMPGYVQKWQSPYEDADMLLLPTHADDEHLYFGGTMPYYSDNKKLQVAYFTNHDTEKYRRHELLDGLWAVGITTYPVISEFRDAYADTIEQAKAMYPENEAIEYIVSLLRRFKPEVVIAHDFNGEYGHGAHKYNAYILAKALDIAADETQLSQYPKAHDTLKAYFHLYPENEIIMDWNVPLLSFNGKTALDVAKSGYDAHKSQHKWDFAVEDFGAYDCRKFGLYRTKVGIDIKQNDFFENIEAAMYSDYIEPTPESVAPIQSSLPNNEQQSEAQSSSAIDTPINEQDNPLKTVLTVTFIPLFLAFLAIFLSKSKSKK